MNDETNDDITFEPENNEAPETSFKKPTEDGQVAKLEEALAQCKAEKEEYLQGWQRSKADYVNLKNRAALEKAELSNYAKEDLLLEMIRVADNFEMAFKDKEAWEKAPENWRKGIEYIYNNVVQVLTDHGVTALNPLNETFNPGIHDAVEMIETDDQKKDHIILEVIQKGYKLKDRVIRHASVKVGQFKKA